MNDVRPPSTNVTPPTRRLAAVMLADVVGYSRQMEVDEAGTHLRLTEARERIIDPAIARHHGRAVRSKGDDLLVEFASAIEALSCAVEIQREMAEHARGLAPQSRLELRIGINLGDILIDGSEIVGDGVNVAARLEKLAEPGGIAVSRAVREQVRQLVGVHLTDAGEHRVKNISRPIRVYRVRLDERRRMPAVRWRRWRAPALVAGTLAFAAALWLIDPLARLRGPAPDLSVALLPVTDRTGQAEGAALARALTSQLTTALVQSVGGPVAAESVAAQHNTAQSDAQRAGRALNVRYVVEASVQSVGPAVRVSAQLTSVEHGAQLWSSTLEAPRTDGTLPVALAGRLAETLGANIRHAELKRLQVEAPEAAHTLVLQARARLPATETLAELQAVRRQYEQALRVEPTSVAALAGLANALTYEAGRAATAEDAAGLLKRADEASLQAVSLEPTDADAWRARAQTLVARGQLAGAAQAIERALLLNPFSGDSHAQYGVVLTALGRSEEAITALDQAIALNPAGDAVGVHLFHRARALLYLGRYDEAIDSCTRGLAYAPDWPDFMLLAAAYAMKGDRARAAEARAELLRREPTFAISWLLGTRGAIDPKAAAQRDAHLVAGLRRAGLPD